eukprot:TRINITY_DN36584_c0_g1_i3.p1 TRINITY_DN36584_c0_g1~~TRINITY_DN36584_c0_g1_i3.p1  ORF type:complete len:114 (+),score=6.75 TRINITY_DN36584_c0_g1_i3:728-1069(+)
MSSFLSIQLRKKVKKKKKKNHGGPTVFYMFLFQMKWHVTTALYSISLSLLYPPLQIPLQCPFQALCVIIDVMASHYWHSTRTASKLVQLANQNQLVDHYASKHPKEKPPGDSG